MSAQTTSGIVRLNDVWALRTLNGQDIQAINCAGGIPSLELHTTSGRVHGFGGCNEFHGSAVFEADTIRFGALAATRKYCSGAGGDIESGLLEVLKGSIQYSLDGLQLTLTGKGGVAVFKKVD